MIEFRVSVKNWQYIGSGSLYHAKTNLQLPPLPIAILKGRKPATAKGSRDNKLYFEKPDLLLFCIAIMTTICLELENCGLKDEC